MDGSTTVVSPNAAAIDSRVRSSGVGPRPPVEMTRSARAIAVANASVTASRSIREGRDAADADPSLGQRPGELAGIRVAGLADGQLGADAQELGGAQPAAGIRGRGRGHVSGPPSGERTAAPVRPFVRARRAAAGIMVLTARDPARPSRPARSHDPGRPDDTTTASGRRRQRGPPPAGTPPAGTPPPPGAPKPPKPPKPPGLRAQFGSTARGRHAPRHGPCRAGQGRGDGHRWPDRPGRRPRRRRDRPRHRGGQPGRSSASALFLGEWMLGSMGWGVLHGFLPSSRSPWRCVLLAVGDVGRHGSSAPSRWPWPSGSSSARPSRLDIPNWAYTAIGERADRRSRRASARWSWAWSWSVCSGSSSGSSSRGVRRRPYPATAIGALVIGVARRAPSPPSPSARRSAPASASPSATSHGWPSWPRTSASTGIDVEALKARFYPTQTIETSKETLEWLQKRMPPGIG